MGAPRDLDGSQLSSSRADVLVFLQGMQPIPMAHAQPVGGGGVRMNQQGAGGGARPSYMPAPASTAAGFHGGTPNAYQGGAKRAQAPQETWKPSLGSPVLCDAASGSNFPLEKCRVEIDVHMASMFVKMVCSWRVGADTTGLFKRTLPSTGSFSLP